jgi:arginine repressor
VYAVNNQQELNEAFENLIRNEDIRHEKDICAALLSDKGATATLF